ncbi:MAG: hypothetical protein WKF84_13075 [Pyrinomonadaceae bacterium]
MGAFKHAEASASITTTRITLTGVIVIIPPYPYGTGIFYSVPYNNQSYESGSLTLQLQELETARAGLHARWRALEDEARRAGASPGWLRP